MLALPVVVGVFLVIPSVFGTLLLIPLFFVREILKGLFELLFNRPLPEWSPREDPPPLHPRPPFTYTSHFLLLQREVFCFL